MPVTLNSTGISFSDGNNQNSAASAGMAGVNTTDFNTSGTYNKPASSKALMIGIVSGGGGGGNSQSNVNRGGTGGAGGAGIMFINSPAIPSSFPIGVGAGGTTVQGTGNTPLTGSAGGSSNISTYFSINGGNGGNGYQPAVPPNNGNPGNVSSGTNIGFGAFLPTPTGASGGGSPGYGRFRSGPIVPGGAGKVTVWSFE